MHERMEYINELVRNGTSIGIITPANLLNREEKKKAIESLRNDDEIDIEIEPALEDSVIITVSMKEQPVETNVCGFCKHLNYRACEITGKHEDRIIKTEGSHVELSDKLFKEACKDYEMAEWLDLSEMFKKDGCE